MRTFDSPEPLDVIVETMAGRVDVTAHETDTATVELTALKGDADAQSVIDNAIVVLDGPRLVVRLQHERRGLRWRAVEIAVAIGVPTGSSLTCRAGSAGITTHGELSWVDLTTGSGDVELERVDGRAVVRTGSGDVQLTGSAVDLHVTAGSGDLRIAEVTDQAVLRTGSGDVTVRHGRGRIEIKCGSGDITLEDVHGEVIAKTGSGDVCVTRATTGRFQTTSASGDVRIGVATGTAAWLDLNTVTGDVRSELDDAEAPPDHDTTVELHVKTATGDITVARA